MEIILPLQDFLKLVAEAYLLVSRRLKIPFLWSDNREKFRKIFVRAEKEFNRWVIENKLSEQEKAIFEKYRIVTEKSYRTFYFS
jgi:hypothetical protein